MRLGRLFGIARGAHDPPFATAVAADYKLVPVCGAGHGRLLRAISSALAAALSGGGVGAGLFLAAGGFELGVRSGGEAGVIFIAGLLRARLLLFAGTFRSPARFSVSTDALFAGSTGGEVCAACKAIAKVVHPMRETIRIIIRFLFPWFRGTVRRTLSCDMQPANQASRDRPPLIEWSDFAKGRRS